jgi:LmbE family N-acetylglucosaminyl deacetylase
MAHPDDAEIWCGGTLILHADKGDTVRICALSYGEDSTRGAEAREGAARMGCEVELLGLTDTAIRDTDEAAERLRRSIDAFRPDAILTHWHDDTHPDHEAVFLLVRRALLRVHLSQGLTSPANTPRVFCCDTYGSVGLRGRFRPDRLVDISSVWERKLAAAAAHESQPTPYFLQMIDRQTLAHGRAAGTERAEGFLYVPLFGRPDDGTPL